MTQIGSFDLQKNISLPLFLNTVQAGFPSPAESYSDTKLNLNSHLITNPNSTFFVTIAGDSMVEAGINSGDIAIVDRSLEPKNGNVILAVVDGDFTVKKLEITEPKNKNETTRIKLMPANSAFEPIEITEQMVFQVWGVVTFTIHKTR
jgi:DNA polymerase V